MSQTIQMVLKSAGRRDITMLDQSTSEQQTNKQT